MPENIVELERFVDRAGPLYSLPTVAVEILQLTAQPKVDLSELKKCLMRDPALVSKMLRVVNSSLFGLSRGVSDLNQALALLGTKSVRLLVLGFSLPEELFAGLTGDILRRYWHHTAIKATAAREISESIYRMPGEEPFIAGLLQDLGMLVLIQQLGEPYVRFLERAFAKAVDVSAAETVTLGFDHVQLSARLLQRWSLPENLVAAIGVGNSTERMEKIPDSQKALPQILHLADLLSGMLAEGRTDWLGGLLGVGQHYHQLSGTQLTALVSRLRAKVDQFSNVLSVELPADINYESILAEAYRRLTTEADSAATDLSAMQQFETAGIPVVAAANLATNDAREESAVLGDAAALSEAVRRFSQQAAKKMPGKSLLFARTPAKAALQAMPKHAGAPSPAMATTVSQDSNGSSTLPSVALSGTATQSAASLKNVAVTENKAGISTELLRSVEQAIATCRRTRQPLSLVLVEIDQFEELSAKWGGHECLRLAKLVSLTCSCVEHAHNVQLQTNECRFALVLPNCDRPGAGEIGHQILSGIRRLSQRHRDVAEAKLKISVGVTTVAMLAKNFLPAMLLDSADRCLHAAQLSGGNTLKSIDVL
ncbi:MAG TPA: HDOD domain-containing protein [Pirellulales bacterium]|jgi:HD-like signal output (HDOD) protein/GGDEF domain-containing protein|nr:HDOD domain-containing protein [Pirellulales bacterium]